jgi:hypothetical protein
MVVELRKRKAPAPPPVPEKKTKTTKAKTSAPAAKPKAPAKKANPSEKPSPKTTVPVVGDKIDLDGFGGEIETNDGDKTSLKALLEESKSGVVLFTYPRASTPGCKLARFLFSKKSDWFDLGVSLDIVLQRACAFLMRFSVLDYFPRVPFDIPFFCLPAFSTFVNPIAFLAQPDKIHISLWRWTLTHTASKAPNKLAYSATTTMISTLLDSPSMGYQQTPPRQTLRSKQSRNCPTRFFATRARH